MITLQELEQMAVDDIQEYDFADPGDVAHEIADNLTPHLTSEIMNIGARNTGLASTVPGLGPAFDGEPSAKNIMAAAIYEHLYDKAVEAGQRKLEKE